MAKLSMRVDFPARRGRNGAVIPVDSITVVDLPAWWPEDWLAFALAALPERTRGGGELRAVLGMPNQRMPTLTEAGALQRRAIEAALMAVADLIEAENCAPEKAVTRIRGRIAAKSLPSNPLLKQAL